MSNKVDIWMPLYVRDYLGATSRLTTEQHGAYLLIIMDYWLNGPPPDDDSILSSIARLSPEQWSKHRASIERLFTVHNGSWKHKRIDREIESAHDRRKQAKERGKKGAKARWAKNDRASNGPSIEQAGNKQWTDDGSSPSSSPTPPQSQSKSKDSGSNEPVESAKREPDRSAEIREVFNFWKDHLKHPRAKLDDKRKRKIRDRLKDGYEASDLMEAIKGIRKSPHHMGENDRATVYDDIELICRDGPHVDKFIKLSNSPDLTKMGSSARKTATAAQRWLENGD